MKRDYLFTPGPTPVPERALLAMARPIMHHRKPEFSAIFRECADGLKWLFQTKNDVLIFASSGTGAMEGSVTNFLSPGDKVITVNAGKFGERWTNINKAFGMNIIELKAPWGKAISVEEIEKTLAANKDVKALYIQGSETSTGAAQPIKSIGKLIKEKYPNVLFVVDAITALGVMDMPCDEWGIDILVTGSQKALMLPPGLAFASVSDKAWDMSKSAKCQKFYFNWTKERKNLADDTTAWTPAVTLIIGLREVLAMMKEEGLDNVFKRHALLARATREAMKACNLELFAGTSPSNAVTSVLYENSKPLIKGLKERYGVTIAAGQDDYKDKIFRIANLGYYTHIDSLAGVGAIEMVLHNLGHKFERGSGLAAAEKVLTESKPEEWTPKYDNYCAL